MSSLRFSEYDKLIHRIYDAALAPTNWPVVLEELATMLKASHGLLYTPMHAPSHGGLLFPHNLPQKALDLWAVQSPAEDPFVAEASARRMFDGVEGTVIRGSELVPFEKISNTKFYRLLWEPIGIGKVCSGLVFNSSDAHKIPTVLALYRRPSDPDFDDETVGLMKGLLAHISRSLGVMFHLRDSQLQAATTLAAINRLPAAVMLLDKHHYLKFTNLAAQKFLAKGDPVSVEYAGPDTQRIVLPPRLDSYSARFQEYLAGTLKTSMSDAAEHFSNSLFLPGDAGAPGCVLHAAPFFGQSAFEGRTNQDTATTIVIAYDFTDAGTVDPDVLCRTFGTTPAEACAAIECLRGGSYSKMAERLGISQNTLKNQLKAVYAKTGTKRQTDLLKLLLALAIKDEKAEH
ncbi:hypothetical protein GT347_01255 [Xylophilus rhododendri]|uniref:HTH luxR-type domain-containing protein n=1 Tax=Xylophilus rhododendri TaxID=2697032 RepID=A0A857J195_9BURK|nr:helix-turn-helix transcriptional regulator [Xylophilus rhododendri]QHI96738.1 hypothetical protein GT347_01255 [Xylophilus rhododendri]